MLHWVLLTKATRCHSSHPSPTCQPRGCRVNQGWGLWTLWVSLLCIFSAVVTLNLLKTHRLKTESDINVRKSCCKCALLCIQLLKTQRICFQVGTRWALMVELVCSLPTSSLPCFQMQCCTATWMLRGRVILHTVIQSKSRGCCLTH